MNRKLPKEKKKEDERKNICTIIIIIIIIMLNERCAPTGCDGSFPLIGAANKGTAAAGGRSVRQ